MNCTESWILNSYCMLDNSYNVPAPVIAHETKDVP